VEGLTKGTSIKKGKEKELGYMKQMMRNRQENGVRINYMAAQKYTLVNCTVTED
jgi:hypothetical protein